MSIKQAIEALDGLLQTIYGGRHVPLDDASSGYCNAAVSQAESALDALRSMPQGEPVATIRYERGTPGKENDMPKVVSCNWLPDGVYSVYVTQHTEAVRMSEAEIRQWWASENGFEDLDMCKIDDFRTMVRAVEQATAARLGVKMGDV